MKLPWKKLERVVLVVAASAGLCAGVVHAESVAGFAMTMMSALQVEGPCIMSAMGAPQKNCIPWEPNVSAVPTYEPSRRLVFSGAADDMLHVVDADSGRPNAFVPTKGRVVTKVIFGATNGRAYFGTEKGTLYCLDAYTFKEVFSLNADGRITNNLRFVDDKIIFTTAVGTIYGIDAMSGVIRFRIMQPLAKERLRLSSQSNIIAVSGKNDQASKVIVPHNDGYLSVIDAGKGKLIQRIDLGLPTVNGFPDIVAPMVVFHNRLWVASHDLGLFVIDLSTERIREQIPVTGVLGLTTDGNAVFAATADEVMAFAENGVTKWRGDFSGVKSRAPRTAFPFAKFWQGAKRMFFGTPSGMLVDERHVLLSTSLGSIGVFDKETGRLIKILGNSVGFSGMDWSGLGSFIAISKRGILMKFGS